MESEEHHRQRPLRRKSLVAFFLRSSSPVSILEGVELKDDSGRDSKTLQEEASKQDVRRRVSHTGFWLSNDSMKLKDDHTKPRRRRTSHIGFGGSHHHNARVQVELYDDSSTMFQNNPDDLKKPASRKSSLIPPQPPGTQLYTAGSTDTLSSLAARSNATTSQLIKLNKLMSTEIFPGQVLILPKEESSSSQTETYASSATELATTPRRQRSVSCITNPAAGLSTLKHDKVSISWNPDWMWHSRESLMESSLKDNSCYFIKARVDYLINDQNVIGGTLFLTPGLVHFAPATRDSSRANHLMAPLESFVSVAIYRTTSNLRRCHKHADLELFHYDTTSSRGTSLSDFQSVTSELDDMEGVGHKSGSLLDQDLQATKRRHRQSSVASTSSGSSDPRSRTTDNMSPRSRTTDNMSMQEVLDQLGREIYCTTTSCKETDESSELSGIPCRSSVESTDPQHVDKASVEPPTGLGGSEIQPDCSTCGLIGTRWISQSTSDDIMFLCFKVIADQNSPTSNANTEPEEVNRQILEHWMIFHATIACKFYNYFTKWTPSVYGKLNTDDIDLASLEQKSENGANTAHVYKLYVQLKEGRDLVIKNWSGTSDPYVKFKMGKELVYRSRVMYKNLNPKWMESFTLNIRDLNVPIRAVVRDYSVGMMDDFIGEAIIEPSQLVHNEKTEVKLLLTDKSRVSSKERYLGQLSLQYQLIEQYKEGRLTYELSNVPLPDLSECSSILEETHLRTLREHLPACAEGRTWNLVYSADNHGFSLHTLYNRMNDIDCSTMLIIKDTNNQVFGAVLPCTIKLSDGFYGIGKSFLFTFHQEFKKFAWTGRNNFCVKGSPSSVVVGSGGGVYGLWLDGSLDRGRSEKCETYDNEPLTQPADFRVSHIETWSFD